MKKLIFILTQIVLACYMTVANTSLRPTGLMVDFMRAPSETRLTNRLPLFSWQPPLQYRQLYWKILVSADPDRLNKGDGECWNSGKISGSSTSILYGGKPLENHKTYYWKVQIWGQPVPSATENKGKNPKEADISSTAPCESAIQQFHTGVLIQEYSTPTIPLVKHAISPSRIEKGNQSVFLDFGKAAFGTMRIKVKAASNDTILVSLGEKLSAATTIDANPGGTIRYQSLKIPVKKGTDWYEAKIVTNARTSKYPAILMPNEIGEVMPFRYGEIKLNTKTTSFIQAEQLVVNYFWDDAQSSFSSSDSVLNQVWNLCKYSIKATTFSGYYVDGDRERIPYEADAYINQLGHYYTDLEYGMGRRTHEYLITNPTWPTEWIMFSVLIAYNDYLYTGDARSMARFYEDLKNKTLFALSRPDGLISTQTGLLTPAVQQSIHFTKQPIRDIVDWPLGERDGYEMVPVNTVINAFHYQALKLMSEMAKALNKKEDASFFASRAQQVLKAVQEKLIDPQTGYFVDGEGSKHPSLHANMFPMAFGMVPANRMNSVGSFIASKGMACSVYGAQFLLEALYQSNQGDKALELMRSTTERSWFNMISAGSTITLEAWDIKFKPNLDWNHAWGAAPANAIGKGMWGIVPLKAGYEVAQIKPQTGNLTEASIKVPTLKGGIEAKIKTDNNSYYQLDVRSPLAMSLVVLIPDRGFSKPILYKDGTRVDAVSQNGYLRVEIPGGSYHFVVKGE